MSETASPSAPPLSPAEATVLLSPNIGHGYAPIKATLLLLLTTGLLRVEETEEPGFFRNRVVAHLRIVAEPESAPPEIAAVLNLVRAAQPGGKIRDIVKLAEKTFGPRCIQYNAKYVLPALIARGLLEQKKVLFVRSFHTTAAGAKLQARIKSDLFKADDVARLLKSDPVQAAAIAATLGTTILLSDKLTKQFKPLADAMRLRGDSGGDVPAFADSGTHHASSSGGFDFGSFDLGSFDTAAVDALHSGIGAFDSGFSDAGGGHHGDSGGGGHH
jgi:hypothetical protein